MANLRLRLVVLGILGAIVGILFAYILMAMTSSPGIGFHFDYIDVWLKAGAYFSTKGGYSSIYFKLMFGAVFGMAAFMFIAAFLLGRTDIANQKALYAEIDLNSRFLVKQRNKETLMIGIGFLVCVGLILFAFRWLHAGIESHDYLRGGSGNPIPGTTLIVTFVFSVACTYGALISIIAVVRYGKYSHVPIEFRNDSIHFFQSFYGLPIMMIDRPVEVSLKDAEIDFDSQSGKSSIYVYDFEDKIAISPKFEFVNGSFDELADYLEKFAVEED